MLTTGRVLSWTAFAIFTVYLLACAVVFVLLVLMVAVYPEPGVLGGAVFGFMLLVVGLPPLVAYAVDALLGYLFPLPRVGSQFAHSRRHRFRNDFLDVLR